MTELTAAAILGETVSLMRRNAWRAAVALAVLTALAAGIDIMTARGAGGAAELNLVISLASLVLQFWVTAALLEELGLRTSSGGGFWAVFGVCFLTNLGILAGFVLLIVPGIVLAVRWSVSVPYALGDDYESVTAAIGRSWRETQGRAWPIFLALLFCCYAPVAVAAFAMGFLQGIQAANAALVVACDALMYFGIVAGWHAAVAIYQTLRGAAGLDDVFA